MGGEWQPKGIKGLAANAERMSEGLRLDIPTQVKFLRAFTPEGVTLRDTRSVNLIIEPGFRVTLGLRGSSAYIEMRFTDERAERRYRRAVERFQNTRRANRSSRLRWNPAEHTLMLGGVASCMDWQGRREEIAADIESFLLLARLLSDANEPKRIDLAEFSFGTGPAVAVQSGAPGGGSSSVTAHVREVLIERPQVAPAPRPVPTGGSYRDLVAGVEGTAPGRRVSTVTRHQRSARARQAVIARSRGRCENPKCPNPGFNAVTDAGDPILEVDHVKDLALGGEDHPANMIALCPNCHAVKTRGQGREQLRAVLAKAARELHARALRA